MSTKEGQVIKEITLRFKTGVRCVDLVIEDETGPFTQSFIGSDVEDVNAVQWPAVIGDMVRFEMLTRYNAARSDSKTRRERRDTYAADVKERFTEGLGVRPGRANETPGELAVERQRFIETSARTLRNVSASDLKRWSQERLGSELFSRNRDPRQALKNKLKKFHNMKKEEFIRLIVEQKGKQLMRN